MIDIKASTLPDNSQFRLINIIIKRKSWQVYHIQDFSTFDIYKYTMYFTIAGVSILLRKCRVGNARFILYHAK